MDGDDDLEVNGASGGPRWRLLSWWSSWHRAVEHACEGKRKTMTVSSDWWVRPVIYRTGMGTGLAGSWAAAQVSLSTIFYFFVSSFFLFSISFFSFFFYFLVLFSVFMILLDFEFCSAGLNLRVLLNGFQTVTGLIFCL
jgi:hypothetical protein